MQPITIQRKSSTKSNTLLGLIRDINANLSCWLNLQVFYGRRNSVFSVCLFACSFTKPNQSKKVIQQNAPGQLKRLNTDPVFEWHLPNNVTHQQLNTGDFEVQYSDDYRIRVSGIQGLTVVFGIDKHARHIN